jgi:anti-sigma B factor antagonist
MVFHERLLGDVTVLALNGDVLGGPDATELSNRLRDLLTDNHKFIVIDLADVEYMNSSGLGMMTSALSTVRNAGGSLKIASPAERIKSLLSVTKLDKVFPTFETVDAAVASFN